MQHDNLIGAIGFWMFGSAITIAMGLPLLSWAAMPLALVIGLDTYLYYALNLWFIVGGVALVGAALVGLGGISKCLR